MSKKKILSESEVRRFQGLAGIPSIGEMHCPSGEREEEEGGEEEDSADQPEDETDDGQDHYYTKANGSDARKSDEEDECQTEQGDAREDDKQ